MGKLEHDTMLMNPNSVIDLTECEDLKMTRLYSNIMHITATAGQTLDEEPSLDFQRKMANSLQSRSAMEAEQGQEHVEGSRRICSGHSHRKKRKP